MDKRMHSEGGFTMILTLSVMVICIGLSAVAFGAVVNDLPLRKEGKERKIAYAAAEAGVNFYLSRLVQDNEYWSKCTGAGTGTDPVNQRWDGAGADTRTRKRAVPGGDATYTVELMPAVGATCSTTDPDGTMLDPSTGIIRIRSTGVAGKEKRSVIATMRRKSFLDYLYFTNYETLDPILYGNATRVAAADASCAGRYRAGRSTSVCREIQFSAGDKVNGPFHTNDDILTCNGSTFGRSAADRIETGTTPGYTNVCGSTPPNTLGTFQAGVQQLPVPTSNDKAASAAVAPYIFTGTNRIVLNGNQMTVTNQATGVAKTLPLPPTGVVSVRQGTGCGAVVSQATQTYGDATDCANVKVSGQYSSSLTVVSDKDVIIDGNLTRTSGSDALLGLIATQWVRVYHPVTNRTIDSDGTNGTCTNASGTMQDVTIEAAILSLNHSFVVDNHDCGAGLGTVKVTGAIAQTYRGPVGTATPTGYTKDYNYDDRMRYRNPPFFLDPVAAAWRLVQTNEQVPAR